VLKTRRTGHAEVNSYRSPQEEDGEEESGGSDDSWCGDSDDDEKNAPPPPPFRASPSLWSWSGSECELMLLWILL
jgi:hypothetical protein